MNKKILQYKPLNLEEKLNFIQKEFSELSKLDLQAILVEIFLGKEKDIPLMLNYLDTNPSLAWKAAQFLIQEKYPQDHLNTLKYFGARIIKQLASEMHPKLLIPILVKAYHLEDYRDTRWSISDALAHILKAPIRQACENILEKPGIKEELLCNLESYTSINMTKQSDSTLYQIQKEKSKKV